MNAKVPAEEQGVTLAVEPLGERMWWVIRLWWVIPTVVGAVEDPLMVAEAVVGAISKGDARFRDGFLVAGFL